MKRSLILLILVLAFSACKELFLQIRENIIRTGVVNFVGPDNAIVTGVLLDVADENGEPVQAHGHCWATTENPSLEVNEGFIDYGPAQQFGEFTSLLNDLSPETVYYVRAFAQDASGVQYGDNIRIIPGLVTTDFVTNISTNTAQAQGTLSELLNSEIRRFGHCWALQPGPTLANAHTEFVPDVSEPLLSFVSPLTGLSPDTFHYVRAYAIDSQNQVSYGEELVFRTVP